MSSQWSNEKAARRLELIDKLCDIAYRPTEDELLELDALTEELRAYLKPLTDADVSRAEAVLHSINVVENRAGDDERNR